MIEEISIRGLGVIGEATLPIGPGFTALTGETGAGKTMVVTALGLLLGERADSAAIRSGSTQALVEGHWLVEASGAVADRVRDAGGDLDTIPGSDAAGLLLSRSVSTDGRSRAAVGGRSAPVGVLGEIGQQLVVVHGQSDQIRLRSATAQREALDRFAGHELVAVLDDYQDVYARWQSAQGELDVLVAERDRRSAEAEDLRIAMEEIERVAPQRGEDDELTERADRLTNLEDLRIAAAHAQALVSSQSDDGESDALALLESARRALERAADHDPALEVIAQSIGSAAILVTEVAAQLARYLSDLDADGGRELEVVQERRAELAGLVRRFGPTLDTAIDYLDTGSGRLLELDGDSDRLEALRAEVESDRIRIVELAAGLTGIRSVAALRLSDAVTAELSALAMGGAELSVIVEDRPDYSQTGKDQVSFLLKPHSGSEPRPLGRGASGGELSRVMLAIEVVIAATDPVPTFIFDEVDAGVGGASATEIGRRLAMLAQSAQVIVVTHLAQVAAFANNHLSVVKDSDGSVTESSVRQLTGDDRVAEMARLLSGLPDSESGLTHARELLDMAGEAHPGHYRGVTGEIAGGVMDEDTPVEVTLRPFVTGDDAEVTSWFADAGELRFFAGRRLRWPLDQEQWNSIREDPAVTSFTGVIGDDPTPVAHIELVEVSPAEVELARFAVSPGLRGRGLARATMVPFIAKIREGDYERVTLTVHPNNTTAVLSYRTFGFEPVGEPDEGGRIRMELVLATSDDA